MNELPSGTVTFLFTDIEGSTQLLNLLGGGRYAEMLAEHERLLLAAFAAHQGRVVDTQGDSFFVAFRTAADAVAAAVDAQRDLAAEQWPHGGPVKVRMGLHTGEPRMAEQRYVGIGVHRAARIGAAGHGGQVLLSSTTRELAEEDLPQGVSIRDMGERRLKDLDQPQRLYQLDVDGLQNEFAQLRTLDVELRRKRRRLYAGSALVGVLAAALAIPIFAFGQGGSAGVTVEGNAVGVIDPDSNRVTKAISVGTRPGAIASGSGSLWVANRDDRSVSRIDPETSSVTKAIPVVDTPTGLAAVDGATWVVGSNVAGPSVSLTRIDPQFDTVAPKIKIDNVVPGGPGAAAAVGKTLWIAPSSGYLTRLDPRTGRVVEEVDPNSGPTAIAIGPDAVWVVDSDAGTVTRVDSTGQTTAIPVGPGPSAIALDADGFVWVANRGDDTVVRIDARTRAVTTTITVGSAPTGIAVGTGAVWVANSGDGTVSRIDPEARIVSKTIPVGQSPQSVIAADGRIWVSIAQQTIGTLLSDSPGGTARLTVSGDNGFPVDPAFPSGWSWQLLAATCANLVNYPDKAAPAGSRLIPEVAKSLPTGSADGKTYTFSIRKGFLFSSGEPVTAQTFKNAIERTLSPVMKSDGQTYLRAIIGVGAYESGKASHIRGIVVKGSKLTVHLSAPAPDLLFQLATPYFCAVPLKAPLDPNGVGVIPAAGPYYVTAYSPGASVVLERNPNYAGSRPHQLDRIELTVGVPQLRADAQIEAGTADHALDGIDPGDANRIAARYGRGSPAAQNGRQQYFVNRLLATRLIVLNTHRPLFHDLRLRQAVNYAINRSKLTEIPGDASPTDQYLPPGVPGFKDVDIYPFTPNVPAARRLAGAHRRTAILYTHNSADCGPVCQQLAQVLKLNLGAIGIDVVTKTFSGDALVERIAKPGEPFDLVYPLAWGADYPDPASFLGLPGITFYTPFDDPSYRRKARAASRLSGPRRYLAYGALDVDAVRNAAPVVAVGNKFSRDFFSARMGCQVFNPVYGIDLAALCIRP